MGEVAFFGFDREIYFESAFTPVSGNEAARRRGHLFNRSGGGNPGEERVYGKQTVIGTLAATTQFQLHLEILQLFDCSKSCSGIARSTRCLPLIEGDKSRPVGAHEAGNIRSEHLPA